MLEESHSGLKRRVNNFLFFFPTSVEASDNIRRRVTSPPGTISLKREKVKDEASPPGLEAADLLPLWDLLMEQ